MKKYAYVISLFFIAALLFSPIKAYGSLENDGKAVSLIFSHDIHSHLDAEKITRDGKTIEKGGFAKMQTAINQIKSKYPDSFLLDAGDFAMGTPYQTVFSTDAAELRMMGVLGYDATTFGNHEFDYRAKGLASMLEAAAASGRAVPALLSANIDWERTLADKQRKVDAEILKAACGEYGVEPYKTIKRGGVKIAVFGIMGKEADEFAPESGLYFKDPVETAREVVSEIKAKEDADLIICLSHSGTNEEPTKSEDEILAAEVPEINVILSGHTHTELPQPISVGETIIASCGSYTDKLGHMVLRANKAGKYKVSSYALLPMDSSVKEDQATLKELEKFRALADKKYFSQFGYKMADVLADNKTAFTEIERFGAEQGEDPLGNLIADSYIYAVGQVEGASEPTADIAVVPAGVVRGSFGAGPITAADAFNASSLGYGRDGKPGYPLVSAYLTGKELKAAAEVDATVSEMMPVARLYMSGLAYDYNPNRLFLNRATDIRLDLGDNKYEELKDDKLYRVVADLYSCQMLGSVKEQSFGLLSIEPKDKKGALIRDFEEHIIYDGKGELKAWYALASYIDSFDGDQVPDDYAASQGRKTEVDSWNPVELFKQPNKIMAMAVSAAALLIAVIAGAVLLVQRKRRKMRRS